MLKVLVLENSQIVKRFYVSCLMLLNYHVASAAGGIQALAMAMNNAM
jgi:hypothetical protein